ncbi:hypothetical protein GS531_00360 [Rhodococcus hoagii]|nr:hypothetical protein [Prescottella equi]
MLALAGNLTLEHPTEPDPIRRAVLTLRLDPDAHVHEVAANRVRAFYANHHTIGAAAWRRHWTELTAHLDRTALQELLFHLARRSLFPGDGISFPTAD